MDGPQANKVYDTELKDLVIQIQRQVHELVTDTNMHVPQDYWPPYQATIRRLDLYLNALVEKVK